MRATVSPLDRDLTVRCEPRAHACEALFAPTRPAGRTARPRDVRVGRRRADRARAHDRRHPGHSRRRGRRRGRRPGRRSPGGGIPRTRPVSAHARQALLCGYAVVLLVPLALIAGVMKPGAQGHLVVFADALGFAALSLLAMQVFSSGRWPSTTRAFGLRSVLSLHRQAGIAVLVLVLMHFGLLVLDDPSRLA